MINKYPRLTFLTFGFLAGLTVGLFQAYYGQQTIKEYKEIAKTERARYEKTISSQRSTISTLSNEVTRLKSSERRTVVKNKDGSSREVFEKIVDQGASKGSREDSSNSSVNIKENLEKVTSSKQVESKETTKKLNVYLGISGPERYSLGIDYPVFGPWTLHGQLGINGSESYLFGVGILF